MEDDGEQGRENQSDYRRANRRFLDVVSRYGTVDGQLLPFICECADGDCAARVNITAWRYDDIHGEEGHYVILPGHMRIAGEEIVEQNSYYEIVKKAA